MEGTVFEGDIVGYHVWLLAEATGWDKMPAQIEAMCVSTYRKFWAFQRIRSDDQSHNPAIGRENALIVDILQSVFSKE